MFLVLPGESAGSRECPSARPPEIEPAQSVNHVSTRHTGCEEENREREFCKQEERTIETIISPQESGTVKKSIPYSCNALP